MSRLVILLYRREWKDKKGYLHRTDGPAVENETGRKEYWVDGLYIASEYLGEDYDDDEIQLLQEDLYDLNRYHLLTED